MGWFKYQKITMGYIPYYDVGGKMFFAIFSGVFLLVAAIAVLLGVIRGKRKVWQVSLVRIIMTVVAALLSAAVSLIISWVVFDLVVDSLVSSGKMGDISSLINEVPSAQTAVLALVSMIITPMLFLVFYAIFRPITSVFVKPIAHMILGKNSKTSDASSNANGENERKKLTKEEKNAQLVLPKSHWLSAVLGGFSGLLMLCVLLVPLVGALGVANDIASTPLQELANSNEKFVTVSEVVDASAANVGTVTVKMLGGGLLYDLMTSYPTDDGFATLRHESEFVGSVANAAVTSSDKNATPEKIRADFAEVSNSFDRSVLLPSVIAEMVSAASDDWTRGEDFHGIECPSFGGEDLQPVVTSIIEGLAQSNTETIKTDIRTIVDIVATLVVNDTLDKAEGDPMVILAEEATTSEILKLLLDNPRLCVAVDGISDFGMKLLMKQVNTPNDKNGLYDEFVTKFENVDVSDVPAPMNETEEQVDELAKAYADVLDAYGIRVDDATASAAAAAKRSGADMEAWIKANIVDTADAFNTKTEIISADMITFGRAEITDTDTEAKALAHAFAVIYDIMGDLEGEEFDVKTVLGSMGPALDSFSATQTIGKERTAYILKALLQSELVHDKIGFSVLEATDSANSLIKNSETKQYEGMLNSLSRAVDVVEAASDSNRNTTEAVEAMLEDLTPESAEVIQTMATPNVMKNYGVSDKSAAPVSDMVSDTFGNLSSAKEEGMSDEEYAKESAAVSDMMNVMMSAGSSQSSSVFGEGGMMNKTAGEYIDTIMDSSVMSKTIVDTVYAEGESASHDPLKSERVISDSDKSEFIAAANAKWSGMSAEEQNEESKRELVAMAAVLNIKIELTDAGWVEAN